MERTRNMYHMLLTLDVLKLSGWLNAYASCPTKKEGIHCRRHAGWEARACGLVAVQGAGVDEGLKRRSSGGWEGARAERTPNMRYMDVTLDVSKLSGWLNAYAYCRVKREA